MCKLGHGIHCPEQCITSDRQTCLPSLPPGLPFSVLMPFRLSFTPFTVGEKLRCLQAYTVQAECLSTWLSGEQELGDSCGHGEEDGDGCDGGDGNGENSCGILVVMVMLS